MQVSLHFRKKEKPSSHDTSNSRVWISLLDIRCQWKGLRPVPVEVEVWDLGCDLMHRPEARIREYYLWRDKITVYFMHELRYQKKYTLEFWFCTQLYVVVTVSRSGDSNGKNGHCPGEAYCRNYRACRLRFRKFRGPSLWVYTTLNRAVKSELRQERCAGQTTLNFPHIYFFNCCELLRLT